MTHEEDNRSGAIASVATLPTLFVIVARDAESGSPDLYSVSGSYGMTSGIVAESFAKDVRELYVMGLESLRRQVTSSIQDQSQREQEQGSTSLSQDQQQRPVRSKKDIESSFASTLAAWKARTHRMLNTTAHIDDREAHFKSLYGTSVQVITEEQWEAERARLRDGTLITQYGLDGTALESTVHGQDPRRDKAVGKTRRGCAGWCGSCFTGERC